MVPATITIRAIINDVLFSLITSGPTLGLQYRGIPLFVFKVACSGCAGLAELGTFGSHKRVPEREDVIRRKQRLIGHTKRKHYSKRRRESQYFECQLYETLGNGPRVYYGYAQTLVLALFVVA